MGHNFSSMEEEIGKALAAKDPPTLSNVTQVSLHLQENDAEEKTNDDAKVNNASVGSKKITDKKSENGDQSTPPCMRDKIDNLIEGYLLSGEFKVNAKTVSSKGLNNKKLSDSECCEKLGETTQEKNDTEESETQGERSEEQDNSRVDVPPKGDNSVDLTDKGGNPVDCVTDNSCFSQICDKINDKLKSEKENDFKDQVLDSSKDNSETDTAKISIESEQLSGGIVKKENDDDKSSVVKNSENRSSEDFTPIIPIEKKSTTTFQTLIDRVLDSSLNCKSPPACERTNILECCDESNFNKKPVKSRKLDDKDTGEIDVNSENKPAKINNGRKSSSNSSEDMSISKTKIVCLKDHIEKVLEKSFQTHMIRKNLLETQKNTKKTLPVQEVRQVNGQFCCDKQQSVQDENNAQGPDKSFDAQELVENMIDQSKVINELLLPSTTTESNVTEESTLASLARTASMSFEKFPIQCPSEIAKNDDYMLKFEQKSSSVEKFTSVQQPSRISNSSSSSDQFQQKFKVSPESPNLSDVSYRQNSSMPNKDMSRQQISPGFEHQRMQIEGYSNRYQSKPQTGFSHVVIQPAHGMPRQMAPSNLSPKMYRNNSPNINIRHDQSPRSQHDYSGIANSKRHDQPGSVTSVGFDSPGTMNSTRPVQSDTNDRVQNSNSGAFNSRQVHPGVMNSVASDHSGSVHRQVHPGVMSSVASDHSGSVHSTQSDHQRFVNSSRHEHHTDHNQTICVRDCSCMSCNSSPHHKSDDHVSIQGNGRPLHYNGGTRQVHDNARQHHSNMSPRQSNLQQGISENKHMMEEEIPVMTPVSSAMALGPSPPQHFFHQNRLQHQNAQNQYKRPQLIPSSPPIPSSREFGVKNIQMLQNVNSLSRDNQHQISTGSLHRSPVQVSKQNIGHTVNYMPNKPVPQEINKGYHAQVHQLDTRPTAYPDQRLQPYQDDSWNKMRDELQKGINKQVQNALSPHSPESVLDLSVKKSQPPPPPTHSEDEPLDLTCRNAKPSANSELQIRHAAGVSSQVRQGKVYSDQGPTHIHHLENSVDKFCQNVRPLEENFHRSDKLSAQFHHRVPSAEHTSPKQIYHPPFRAPGSVAFQGHTETKFVPVAKSTTSDPGSVTNMRTMPPPLMMVTDYMTVAHRDKSKPFLPPAHTHPKHEQQLQIPVGSSQHHQVQQYQQPVPRQMSPRLPSPRQPSPQQQQQYQQTPQQKRQESPAPNNDVNNQSRNGSKRSNSVSKHEPMQNIIGIHSPSDILYLICRLCGQTYGSPYGFRKHFRNQHGFEPRAEHTIVQTISATKTAMQSPPVLHQGPQVPPTAMQSGVRNIDDQRLIANSPTIPQIGRKTDFKNQESCRNDSLQSPDLESKNMMMVVKKAIDQSVSVAFKTDNNCSANNFKQSCTNECLPENQIQSEAGEEIKFLECHECGQTFQLNDFGSYKRHCRQHGQPKSVNAYPTNDLNTPVESVIDQKSSNENTSGKGSEESTSTICKYCNIPFATVAILKDHLQSIHPEEKKIEIQKQAGIVEDCERNRSITSESQNIVLPNVDSETKQSELSENQNKFAIKVLPASEVEKVPADQMSACASPDSSSEHMTKLKLTMSSSPAEEKNDIEKDNSVLSKQITCSPEGGDFCIDLKMSEDQDSRNSFDSQIKSPCSSVNVLRQVSTESGSLSENMELDKSVDSDSESVRYLHKKFKRKGSISVSSDVSYAKNLKLSENVLNVRSPCSSVKSPGANSTISNDSEVSNLPDGNKKTDENNEIELEMPELKPGVDFTEVDDISQDRSKLILKLKCGPDGLINKQEARHQLPFVWDRITRSQAGKNIKPPTYH